MLELEENLRLLNLLQQKLNNLKETLAIDSLKAELETLNKEIIKTRFLG